MASHDLSRTYCLRGEIAGLEEVFVLSQGENRLGALESNEVPMPMPGVSRVHARLWVENDALHVEDLQSKNGTFIDGRRVRSGQVELNGEVRFGPVHLRFREYHQDDGELAISFDPGSDPSIPIPRLHDVPLKTGTLASSLSNQWLVLAEAFQDRLLRSSRDDVTHALSLLRDELRLDSVCVLEVPTEGDAIVLHAVGRIEDGSAADLRRRFEPLRPSDRDETETRPPIHYEAALDDAGQAITVAVVRPVAADPLALVLWGKFPGRRDSELLMRLLVRMLEQHQVGSKHSGDSEGPTEYPGLVVPHDYVYGRSDVMCRIYDLMQTLAQGDLPVLIIGETGVGKEYLANILHDSSPRRRGPFVAINCAAIPSELLESELFGIGEGVATGVSARKGRFQMADGGTLFLDEIGDMSADLQAKLLRALQEKEVHPLGKSPLRVDVRVLGATNQDLSHRIHDGSFRADLYYRLAGYVLEIPPLRERKEDVPPLVEHFLRACAAELKRSIRGLTVRALRMLTEYPWPGNVRELANEVRRAVYLCRDKRPIESSTLSKTLRGYFDENDLEDDPDSTGTALGTGAIGTASKSTATSVARAPEDVSGGSGEIDAPSISLGFDSLDLEQLERRAIREALRRCGGNQVQAAKLLGITRQKLRRRMEKMGELPAQKSASDDESSAATSATDRPDSAKSAPERQKF